MCLSQISYADNHRKSEMQTLVDVFYISKPQPIHTNISLTQNNTKSIKIQFKLIQTDIRQTEII